VSLSSLSEAVEVLAALAPDIAGAARSAANKVFVVPDGTPPSSEVRGLRLERLSAALSGRTRTGQGGRRLLAAARGNRLWAAYELAVRIGLRHREVLGLRWTDVDLSEGVLTVRQALQHVGRELLTVPLKNQRSARRWRCPPSA
jgi:integrase